MAQNTFLYDMVACDMLIIISKVIGEKAYFLITSKV